MEFEPIYDACAERLLVYFTRRTLDPETALDLWAETLAQGYAGWRRFRGTTQDEGVAWLYAIAANQWAGYLRRGYAERRAMRRLGIERPELARDDIERLEELAGLTELRGQVGAALGALPAEQQEALRLRVVEELPYAEVAERLNVTEPAARARVSRGLRRLGLTLEEAT
ncbi:MAG TPA: sigma-70 family RNA polymerase sigma factor [Thermoleophilaceae bacterium]|jgi:RNA polymerase sigma-70 factor (ECF subfamily)